MASQPRLLIFVVAYNAETTIASVVHRIPASLLDTYAAEILIIDDASQDHTFDRGRGIADSPFPIRVLFNPVNQGYGGNQKIGYHLAIEEDFDFVALIHGDGQYAPECLAMLLEPLRNGEAVAVFGSRMLAPRGALQGGMPVYKYIGNKVLTHIQNRLLGSHLSEFHSGYRVYSVKALQRIPFDRNSNDFSFDTEIIIQLLIARLPIVELPIPTHYGDEVCHVNGVRYGLQVIAASIKARLQRLSLFYDRRFDCAPESGPRYAPKLTFTSSHTMALDRVRPESRVLDIGRGAEHAGHLLEEQKECIVVEAEPRMDISVASQFDVVLMLDVLEHLPDPEAFLDALWKSLSAYPSTEVIITTANVGFAITRLMLLMGQFNYGKRGILDLTHTRLFTFGSLRRTLEQAGFSVIEERGIPAPFPLAMGDQPLGHFLSRFNQALIRFSRGLFSYQILMKARPRPSLELLLRTAFVQSKARSGVGSTTV